jgi:hypothetical protein
MTYQLRRLRLHGLIERLPGSFRYRVTEFGLRVALFFTRVYNRLLRPSLAAAVPSLRHIATPLKTRLRCRQPHDQSIHRASATRRMKLDTVTANILR